MISDIETDNNVIAEYGICTVYSEPLYGTVRVCTEKREKIIYPALGFVCDDVILLKQLIAT